MIAAATRAVAGQRELRRLRVVVRGAVQGVGFRPFVYRLASEMALPGWVLNSAAGVFVEVEGEEEALDRFRARLEREAPPRAIIQRVEVEWLAPLAFERFEIRHSDGGGAKSALILPDLATCDDCRAEIFDPANRRFRYPFTNCTNCGPRYTIIEALPYDRPNTTMRAFPMCARCRAEYESPLDRRFHAQPNACPECGPQLALWGGDGRALATRDDALRAAVAAIRRGEVVALKGLGGFHLVADATNEAAVHTLRERKGRPDKPLAIMAPSMAWVEAHCAPDDVERALLRSAEAPIVLLQRRGEGGVARAVAPGNPTLGVMLPYTPLHHLLLADLGVPVVATSGNRSDEPIVTDEREALERLGGIAALFLAHDRPIVRPVDDSVVRVMVGAPTVLRRARGYAPLPLRLPVAAAEPLLAVGAQQKNTVALAVGRNAFLGQHLGDLDTADSVARFRECIGSFERLYEAAPARIAHDAHPDYHSTRHALASGAPTVAVQHHHAHVLSCMAEHALRPPLLGVAWDGTGDGRDGTVWGGEFLRVTEAGFERVATLRPFRLLGGERAVREPRRVALALLYELVGEEALAMDDLPTMRAIAPTECAALATMARRGLNAPVTTSMGRLFDGVAALIGLRQRVSFEGQAAMELEWLAEGVVAAPYPFPLGEGAPRRLDWGPMVHAIIADVHAGRPAAEIAAAFHGALAGAIVAAARASGERRVVLTGGCFQNRVLTEGAVAALRAADFDPYWHQTVPPNDGGIALGQLMAALPAPAGEGEPCV